MNTNPIKMIMKHNHPNPFTKLQLLSHTLNAILAFGSLCFVFLTFDLLKTGIFRSWGIAVLLFYLMMMTTGLLRQIPVQFKAISGILFFYSLSFMIMLHPGMTGFPLIYFLAVSGVTGLFFGFSAGFITCIIHLIFLFSITGLHSFSFIFNPQQNLPPAADAADFVITFFVFNLVVVHLSAWAAKSLDAQEKRVTNFIELIDTVVFAMDPDYNITQANKKITDILGYTLDEWVGSNLLDFLPPEKKEELSSLLQYNDPDQPRITLTSKMRHKDHTWSSVQIIISASGMPDASVRFFEGIIKDTCEKQAFENEIDQLKHQIENVRGIETQGILSGGVAHDLNNILSGIATYPEILLLDQTLSDPLRKGLETIRQSGRKAAEIVNDLLTLSRGPSAEVSVINMNSVVDHYIDSPEYQNLLELHPTVDVELRLDPELLNIRASYIHIEKSLMNLVTNAFEEVSQKPDPLVTITTANRYLPAAIKGYDEIRPGTYSVLSVADNGSGIDKDDLHRIFDPYYSKKEMGRSGTGLGLTIVKNTVQNHGGYIDIITSPRGTWFGLFFPSILDTIPDHKKNISLEDIKGKGEMILVVDDLSSQREIAESILLQLGYQVITAGNGEEAIKIVKNRQVDLILLDMIMYPGIGGLETYQEIIKIHPGLKTVIASGHIKSDDVIQVQELGAGPFIKKPYTIVELGETIKEELKK